MCITRAGASKLKPSLIVRKSTEHNKYLYLFVVSFSPSKQMLQQHHDGDNSILVNNQEITPSTWDVETASSYYCIYVNSLLSVFGAADMHVLDNVVNPVQFIGFVQRDNVTWDMCTQSDASEQNANVSGDCTKKSEPVLCACQASKKFSCVSNNRDIKVSHFKSVFSFSSHFDAALIQLKPIRHYSRNV